MKDSTVINLFGGPGIGKSTTTSGIFTLLKLHNIDCEMSREYAKEIVWEDNLHLLEDQEAIFEEQYRRLDSLYGKVDVIITDSPLINSVLYSKDKTLPFVKEVIVKFKQYNNINYILNRTKPYNPNGRVQDENKSKLLDGIIKDILIEYNIDFYEANGNHDGINVVVTHILLQMGRAPEFHIGSS